MISCCVAQYDQNDIINTPKSYERDVKSVTVNTERSEVEVYRSMQTHRCFMVDYIRERERD